MWPSLSHQCDCPFLQPFNHTAESKATFHRDNSLTCIMFNHTVQQLFVFAIFFCRQSQLDSTQKVDCDHVRDHDQFIGSSHSKLMNCNQISPHYHSQQPDPIHEFCLPILDPSDTLALLLPVA
mmetsp:Transcript_27592/g.58639  ORF Transcript_27592/g.58639 Transcript_27592/m.58639 type:complete len:123 (-) Transcript_27592:2631-2999(-)